MLNIFWKKKFVNFMSQASNLEWLLSIVKFESKQQQQKNRKVKNYGKKCISCPYLLQASSYLCKRVAKNFFAKKFLNCESSNLTHAVTLQVSMSSIEINIINIYGQH